MKKQFITWALFALATAGGSTAYAQTTDDAQTTYYSEDFQDGKPTNMTYYDGDGLTINPYLSGTGLECGTWHIIKASSTDTNKFMASTSYFAEAGQANDWMITPQIKIYGEGAKLSWKAIVCDRSLKRDGYKVYISTKSADINDFDLSNPLFSIDEESSYAWQDHEVSLDAYAGKTVYIAFVNDSYDKYVIGIDNISVTGPKATDAQDRAYFELLTPIMTDTGKTRMSVRIINYKSGVLDNCTLCYRINGETEAKEYSEEFAGLNLQQGETATLTALAEIEVPVNTSCIYDAWIEVEGDPSFSQRDSIRGTYFISNRRTLFEEGTGTWCGNCPGGEVALRYMEENYPDNVISIAVHGDNNDPMYYAGYIQFCGFSSYPNILTDRKFLSLPANADDNGNFSLMNSGAEYFYLLAQRQLAEAELSGTATYTDRSRNRLEVSVDSRFINDTKSAGYDIALILIEDSVTAPDGSLYVQYNYFSGDVYKEYCFYGLKDTLEACGGWAYKGTGVRMKYDHVARAAYNGSFDGAGNSNALPTDIKGGETYTSTYTWDVDEGVVNDYNRASVVALMTDVTGYIVNAVKMPVVISPESIANLSTDKPIQIIPTEEGIHITSNRPCTATLYRADGTLLATFSGEGSLTFPVTQQGIYLVKVQSGEETIIKKIIKQ